MDAPAQLGMSLPAGFSPPILFFFLGAAAALARSNLHVPKAVTRLLSLYLLWAIGFRGGTELAAHGLPTTAMLGLGAAMFMACVTPIYVFFLLKRRMDAPTAAAMAATYGSISAVTFMTACSVLEARGIPFGGHMVAAMALMESPAIVIAVLLLRWTQRRDGKGPAIPWGKLLHEAFLNGAVVLLLGSLAIGVITGERGYQAFKPLCTDLFNGVLVFFLLDLGLVAVRRGRALRAQGPYVIGFGIAMPLANAALTIALARLLNLPEGDSILLAVLAASASYIAVPAAMRLVIPEASPGVYIPMALAVTFPFNIAVGIPLYTFTVHALWPTAS